MKTTVDSLVWVQDSDFAVETLLSPEDILRANTATDVHFLGVAEDMLGNAEREAIAAAEVLRELLLAGEQTRCDDESGPHWYVTCSTPTEQLLRQIAAVESCVYVRNAIWRVGGYGKRKFAR